MEKHHKFSIWYVLIGIWAVLILHNIIFSAIAVKVIPYSQFLELLKDKKVSEVAITSNQIQGRMVGEGGEPGQMFRTVRVDPDISGLLEEYQVTFKGEIESTFFRDLLSWIVPIAIFIGIWMFMMRRMTGQQARFMSLGKNKAKIYVEEDLNVTFEDAAGVDEAKQELVEVIEFLREPERFTRLGGKMPRGILLVGPPGTGKTLLAKAVAGESNVPFFSLSGSEFVEMFVGLGAARVRDLFTQAKEKAPCIIFIDELDALGKARGVGGVGGHDEREQTLNQLLVEMDGFDPQVGVILMAATNRPEILDPALLRPGRFDRQILVDRPDKTGREAILRVHIRDIQASDEVDLAVLSGMTPGMVGADLANLINEAALLAVRKGKDKVEMADFEEAVERIVAGLEKKNRLINPREREIVAFHEMGHAMVALSLPGTDPVQKISIIPRGIAALGYTMQVPTEDRFLMKKTELLNRIATLLGGRAAEEIIFEDISTGAHNDLAKATDIARSMVKEYGMSSTVGQVYFAREKRGQFLDTVIQGAKEYSEATAELIDSEVRDIIQKQYEKALDLLKSKRQILEKGAAILLEKEKIDGSELKAIMASS
ncbi:Cell division-associated, ATP-dependent zinc metalloprotease FtsH [Olavius algarvensis associated proteobacterium Delta 3]|nr:Cell division-associated, ATP-dependent zinc metalloprotease FtsH [Olavius algarvensis associated proteobacterium Delta 3]CAB5136418.1 Cell division-associated, ATP-dependent zinc metalloprotease FtsH [Olavius algarvensis associated proteobacterium Delta 3]